MKGECGPAEEVIMPGATSNGYRWTARTVFVSALAVACAAQTPPSFLTEKAAKVMSLTGQVSVLRDSSPWALQVGDWVHVRQIILSGSDGYAQFQVNDGSTFEVFPNSRLVFRNNPGNLRDLLDVLIGRVKVHIQKFGGQPNSNRVQTPTAVISVRGTIFDVTVEDDDATTLIYVEEGSVAVRHALIPSGEPKILNAGDYIRVYKNQPLAQKSFDKGSAVQHGLRAAADAIYTILYRMPRTGGGGGGVPGGGAPRAPGDTGVEPPPPPPPDEGGPPPPPE